MGKKITANTKAAAVIQVTQQFVSECLLIVMREICALTNFKKWQSALLKLENRP